MRMYAIYTCYVKGKMHVHWYLITISYLPFALASFFCFPRFPGVTFHYQTDACILVLLFFLCCYARTAIIVVEWKRKWESNFSLASCQRLFHSLLLLHHIGSQSIHCTKHVVNVFIELLYLCYISEIHACESVSNKFMHRYTAPVVLMFTCCKHVK